jgi:hypothetical protein
VKALFLVSCGLISLLLAWQLAPAQNPASMIPMANLMDAKPLVPSWVRPGLRLTYYLMTGSLPGSVNGWVPDEEGRWKDKEGRSYSTERRGHSSHGLVQATVAGMDSQTVALVEPFYLFNGEDTTPVLNRNMDMLVTPDTGGDFWMHPQRQAQICQQHPWTQSLVAGQMVGRTVNWSEAGQTYQATAITILGSASRTLYVYDQASGRLLYLSRLTRLPPDIRKPEMTLQDSVSYATFLRFVGVRQLNLPWIEAPMPEWTQRMQSMSYRGQFTLQGPGMIPTPLSMTSDFQIARRGLNWLLVNVRTMMQGTVAPNETTGVSGPGSLPPLGIATQILAGMRFGQEIDRDPQTGFVVRVSHADAQGVALQSDGPLQSFTYVYDRKQGILARRISRERSKATPDMVNVHDVQLTQWR